MQNARKIFKKLGKSRKNGKTSFKAHKSSQKAQKNDVQFVENMVFYFHNRKYLVRYGSAVPEIPTAMDQNR